MSIIIAKIENENCIFLSDTKVSIDNGDKSVTGGDKIRFAPSEGVLKINIIKPRICIAFAGDIKPASIIVHSFIKEKPKKLEDILNFFQNEINLRGCDVEFIIGLIHDDTLPKLYKIDSSNIKSGQSFWIGDKSAFNEFQSYFLNLENSKSLLHKATESFSMLINNSNIETIGDFNISASYNKEIKAFIYDYRAEGYGGYNKLYVEKNKPTVLTEGNVQEGAFVVNNLVSNNTAKPAVCLFFPKGEFGFLFIPISETNIRIKPYIIKGNIKEIVEIVKSEFEIQLTGMYVNNGIINFNI